MKTRAPRKAILLAAGLGTRMRPLSHALPKPMLPLWGLPLIEHVLGLLADWGVEEALINLHHAPSPLLDYLSRKRHVPPRIVLSYEPTILGTGGALRRAAWFLDDSPFWLINTDIAADVHCRPLLDAFDPATSLAVLWVTPDRGPRTVAINARGDVRDFRATTPAEPVPPQPQPQVTFCGLHLLAPAILRYLPGDGSVSIVAAYEAAMRDGIAIHTVAPRDCFWDDLGTPERYLAVHAEVQQRHAAGAPGGRLYTPQHVMSRAMLRRRGASVDGFAAVARNATLAPGARVCRSVVWPGARLGASAAAVDAVIGAGVALDVAATGIAVRMSACPNDPALARAAAWLNGPTIDEPIVIPFAARGSDRRFTRLARGSSTAILVRYGRERRENARHVHHAEFLRRHGIPVPAILDHDARLRLTLEQDLGDRSLERLVAERGVAHNMPIYRQVIDVVADMHRILLAPLAGQLELAFTPRLYRWEHALFDVHMLQGRIKLPARQRTAILDELQTVARRLVKHRPVLIHRDLQSSNILIHDAQPYLIDFQGMRAGAAAYDLASLLCDPYVMLPAKLQRQMLAQYAARSEDPAACKDFWFAAVQRLAQALGAYARLAALPGTRRFAAHIPRASVMLERALDALEPNVTLPHLRGVLCLLHDTHSTARTP